MVRWFLLVVSGFVSVSIFGAGLGGCRAVSTLETSLGNRATVHLVGEGPQGSGPRVLGVVAHPDDELAFAATLYKTATFLDGVCDLVVVTNGEGGFKYSTLAEPLYGLELTEEKIGRRHLPAIRRREQVAGCRILGLRQLIALNQTDHRYTRDVLEVIGEGATVWDLPGVRRDLRTILTEGGYDFVLTHLPVPDTHGHHKAATLLTLEAVASLPEGTRPVVLGSGRLKEGASFEQGLDGYPQTRSWAGLSPFLFDRTQPIGYRGAMDYKVVVNWMIAEHKSQGTLQVLMNQGDTEVFWLYALNSESAVAKTEAWFQRLARPQFPIKEYGASAGVE